MSDQNGIAIFTNGALSASSMIQVDNKGNLILRDFHHDIDLHSNAILNANIKGGALIDVRRLEVHDLVLSEGSSQSVLVLDPELRVTSAEGVSLADGELRVRRIGGFTASGPIDFNKQPMSNVAITGGRLTNVSLVSSAAFRLVDHSPSASNISALVVIGTNGDLRTLTNSVALRVNDLSARSLTLKGDLDMQGNRISAIRSLKGGHGVFESVSVGSLVLTQPLTEGDCGSACKLVGTDSHGKFTSVDLKATLHGVVAGLSNFDSITIGALRLKSTNSGVLISSPEGAVTVSQEVHLKSITTDEVRVTKELSTGTLRIPNIVPGVIGTDSTGKVVGVNDVSVNSIRSEKATLGEVTASSMKINNLKPAPGSSSRPLSADDHGSIVTANSLSLEALKTQSIETSRIEALGGRFENLVVNTVEVAQNFNVDAIVARKIDINGPAIFHNDVFVSGSVSVEGSVIGSGPYVDSSDSRFKRSVHPIENALDKVCALNGVSHVIVPCIFS